MKKKMKRKFELPRFMICLHLRILLTNKKNSFFFHGKFSDCLIMLMDFFFFGNTLVNYEFPFLLYCNQKTWCTYIFPILFGIHFVENLSALTWKLHRFFNLVGFINAFGLVLSVALIKCKISLASNGTHVFIYALLYLPVAFGSIDVLIHLCILRVWLSDKYMHVFYDHMCENVNLHIYQQYLECSFTYFSICMTFFLHFEAVLCMSEVFKICIKKKIGRINNENWEKRQFFIFCLDKLRYTCVYASQFILKSWNME